MNAGQARCVRAFDHGCMRVLACHVQTGGCRVISPHDVFFLVVRRVETKIYAHVQIAMRIVGGVRCLGYLLVARTRNACL